ncbi:hypothetical protein MSG28_012397 [Choristoneura fumiferana]|uniref:Uncharacterized protein n=1 Tax=Choristoneura fumiferana TaxID=7141 RepID=A0ACC0KDP5_CHOFU|nr:hypothetical protein MSG28_012397 [Choristoneura fumiferana]
MIRKKTNHLNLALINVRSLSTGHDELSAAIDRYKPDLIALNETWLRKEEEKFVPAIAGYTLKSNPRLNGKKGGGVGFYIRKGVRARIKDHPPSQLEQMWLELQRSLVQLVNEPTRITDESATTLDLIITDCPSFVKSIHLHHNPKISDHAMVIAELTIKRQKPVPLYIYKRQLSKIDTIAFEADLNSISWEEVRAPLDVNEKVSLFNHYIIALFDKHSPVRQIRINRQSYPWITENIKTMMDLRDAAFKKARRTKKDSHKDYYKILRNYTQGALEREKKAYFTFYVNKNQSQPKRMWNHIKYSTIMGDSDRPQIPEQLCNPDAINNFFLKLPVYICLTEDNREVRVDIVFKYQLPF